jgi:hypothetical protein
MARRKPNIYDLSSVKEYQDFLTQKRQAEQHKRVISFDFSSLYADVQKLSDSSYPPKKKRSFIKGINNGE